ncbi:MAG: winged helix-turn-helix transcriptional regulator [Alphaproteobacteria bacterium]|nr:winged helix-turn-helix transcriptional regulator [Alphaproteobacteria bacterium]
MPNLLFLSSCQAFSDDFREQLQLAAPDFNFCSQYDDDTIYDIAVIEDDFPTDINFQEKNIQTIYLNNNENFSANGIVINKPVKLESLLDSIMSCVNLSARGANAKISFGNYTLDPFQKEIINRKNGKATKLTEREVSIINYLYKAKGKNVSKGELLSEVWGYNPEATTHTVETHIYRLRQKIEENSLGDDAIITEESGYSLNF